MALQTDPVCGRQVDESKAGVEALLSRHLGRAYYFCSMACKQEFDRNRHAYITTTDIVCGKEVDRDEAEAGKLYSDFEGVRRWFCSADCKQRFDQAQGFYTRTPGTETARDQAGESPHHGTVS